METPIFRLIEKELLECRQKIDSAIKNLNELDAKLTDKPDLVLPLAQAIIKEENTRYVIEKLIKLQERVNRGNFEEDK
ncbi:MAG: hypothetical protein RMZ41_001825 [Nostoc sp. DedVER02]|uniref:hypothetical protein n=1 Tax=unclassified Nostoc TaxID=2593658 RepID=UPI002AD30676|nr:MULTISPECIES: hypothetical protein [unclassified Nostoc]MDZ7987102.1 hypothetical protein [Nostoc sp. DedVER02]MDZ8111028.1 hypothetical protein [Nostoc sp. DedVER01b]